MTRQQIISNLHDNFVKFLNDAFCLADSLINAPQVTDYDKQALDKVKLMLKGNEAKSIEKELSDKTFNRRTLDRIEKFYKDLLDFSFEHISESEIWKMFVKHVCYSKIENGKKETLAMLDGSDPIGIN